MRPDPQATAQRLADGVDAALEAHGVPPRPERRRDSDDRGARFAAQARRAREAAEQLVDVDRLTHPNK